MPRGAQVVYPKDAGQIVQMADIFPGAHVVEAGRRVGRAVDEPAARRRRVRSAVVLRAAGRLRRDRAQATSSASSAPRTRRGASRVGDLAEALDETATSTASCSTCWRPGRCSTPSRARCGPAGSSAATSPRRRSCRPPSRRCAAHGTFTEPQSWESMVRGWHVEGLAVRPEHRMIGHTGFLCTARRLADGVEPPVRRRRPSKGAYGEPAPRRRSGRGDRDRKAVPPRPALSAASPERGGARHTRRRTGSVRPRDPWLVLTSEATVSDR